MDNVKKLENNHFPACTDIYKNEDSVVLTMEMPGVSKENLDIRVDKDLLIIDGRKNYANSDGEYRIKEIRPGHYHQEYTIDDTIDRNKITATILAGLVTLTLGLKESEKPRKISVNAQ